MIPGDAPDHTLHWVENDGGRAALNFKGHVGDCVCRAIAIASERPYLEIYRALNAGAKRERPTRRRRSARMRSSAREGVRTHSKWFKEYMQSIGFEWTPTMRIGSGCRVHLRTGELPMGRLVVAVSKHMCAVIDGVIHDMYDPSRGGNRCVYGYWKLKGS